MPPVIKKFDVLGAYDSAGLRGRSCALEGGPFCRSIALSSEVKPGVATRWPNTSPNPSRKGRSHCAFARSQFGTGSPVTFASA